MIAGNAVINRRGLGAMFQEVNVKYVIPSVQRIASTGTLRRCRNISTSAMISRTAPTRPTSRLRLTRGSLRSVKEI